jgi:hypothetical protein
VRFLGPCCPSEYSVPLLGAGRFRRNAILTELAARSEFEPVVVPPAWVGRSRFAVGRFLGCAVFLAAGPAATVKQSHEPLFGFRSPPEYYPADPSRPAAASQHLSWAFVPFSTPGLGGPLSAGLPSPLRSARRVWLPSRRLTPSEPVPVLFHTGGALGIHPSELPPPARFPRVSARKDPHTVFPAVVTVAKATGRPGRPRFLGFDPCESPWRADARLMRRPLAAPLGFRPSRVLQAGGWAGLSPGILSRALPTRPKARPPAPQSLDRLLLGLVRRSRQAAAIRRSSPFRVSAPVRSLHSSKLLSGL